MSHFEVLGLIEILDRLAGEAINPDIDLDVFLRSLGEIESSSSINSGTPSISLICNSIRETAIRTHMSCSVNRADISCDTAHVYLIRASDTGVFKIGVATNVGKRISAMKGMSASSLELVCYGSGGSKLELELHHKFSKNRIHGEWFELSEVEVEEIKGILS